MKTSLIVTDFQVSVPGGSLFAKKWSHARDEQQVPVVLLHDSLGCVDMWRDLPEKLAKALGRPILAYDRLGFGRSTQRDEPPSFQFIREEAEIYFPLIKQEFNLQEYMLLGHSVGGVMALTIAGADPGSCRAVISESTQAFVEERTREGIRQAQVAFSDPQRIERLRKSHGDRTEWILASWANIWLSNEFTHWSLEPELPKVKCPVLVIHGEKDEYGSKKFPDLITQRVSGPSECHFLRGIGHTPHRECEEQFVRLVVEFLDRL